jgi:hypothetical protein
MADALIDNPILNAPFVEPTRYFKFSDEGDHQRHCRRPTLEFLLHPHRTPKKKGKQLAFDTEWTQDRIEENVTGEKKKEKAAKVMTARTLWVPAVNNHGAFGRWAFLEVDDPYDVLEPIRTILDRPSARARKGDKE